ncbi:homeobox protein BEL1 homolog [Phalaenopsis equestris]|uniref:homeobox protein BEL1 homolog n=1 Tax=Phalaenopsis equestris TaxID=78828 RepID=UPI0009E1DC58|nr:homeobox protein BEL1 homolog [Phalaenopsis equestris]
MDRELHGQPAAAMDYSVFSLAGNFRIQGNERQELYNLQTTSAVDFHGSFEQQQNFLFNDAKFFSVVSGSQKLKLSKYFFPARELLSEFCDLGGFMRNSKQKTEIGRLREGETASASSLLDHSMSSLNVLQLQKRQAALLTMLEELDRRYRRYREQMATVASSFEAVAGEGAATVYLALASKAMSRHFRCLRDGIVGQMKAMRKAVAGLEPTTEPGISRGETPRLKLIDHYWLREKRVFQQRDIFMDQQPWRPQRGLPERSVSVLRAWLFDHFLHPYPSDVDKHILARQSGLTRNQVTNWFINARVRLWKPMIEEIYLEEIKEDELNPGPSFSSIDPKKQAEGVPEPDSSFINADCRGHTNQRSFHNYPNQVQITDHFGLADFDLSSYAECSGQSYSGYGVSLTLGLQQHNGSGCDGGGGFSLSPMNHLKSAVIDGEVRKLSDRNLMGAQVLHDLEGPKAGWG